MVRGNGIVVLGDGLRLGRNVPCDREKVSRLRLEIGDMEDIVVCPSPNIPDPMSTDSSERAGDPPSSKSTNAPRAARAAGVIATPLRT